MADDNEMYQWLLGGGATVMLGGFLYLMNANGKTSDDLSAHKILVAEKYLTKDDYTLSIAGVNKNIDRVEQTMRDGNKANLESNEKIRAEMSLGQSTIMTMLSNNNKLSAEVTTGNAAIIAAIGSSRGG